MFILSLRSQECCPSQAGENFTGHFSQEKHRIGLTCSSALSHSAGTFNIVTWWHTATFNSSPFELGCVDLQYCKYIMYCEQEFQVYSTVMVFSQIITDYYRMTCIIPCAIQ